MEKAGVKSVLDFTHLHALGPDTVRFITQHARPITDDRPALEFHRVRAPHAEYRGPFSRETAHTMALIYRFRAETTAPVRGTSRQVEAEVAAARRVVSHLVLGQLYGNWGVGRPASVEYESAARGAALALRPQLLLRAAQAGLHEGRRDEARRLAQAALALAPQDAAAAAFLAELDAPPKR
jgi:hypothetical protein